MDNNISEHVKMAMTVTSVLHTHTCLPLFLARSKILWNTMFSNSMRLTITSPIPFFKGILLYLCPYRSGTDVLDNVSNMWERRTWEKTEPIATTGTLFVAMHNCIKTCQVLLILHLSWRRISRQRDHFGSDATIFADWYWIDNRVKRMGTCHKNNPQMPVQLNRLCPMSLESATRYFLRESCPHRSLMEHKQRSRRQHVFKPETTGQGSMQLTRIPFQRAPSYSSMCCPMVQQCWNLVPNS